MRANGIAQPATERPGFSARRDAVASVYLQAMQIGIHTTPYGSGSGLNLWPIGAPVAMPGGLIEVDLSID